jgi:cobyrinic acid a,c-diamide synthase
VLIERLGNSFLRFADLSAICALAESRAFPAETLEPNWRPLRRFRIAYAQDEAFGGYFPDTLETLEALGAELMEFSPLCDETLPEAVDLVMIGCGLPDRYAEALAANLSLIAALRAHVCQGRRLYSEGSGTAYLGRTMRFGDRLIPGAGILPFDAELLPRCVPPRPVARVLQRDGWLGPKGTTVRGYRSCRWRLRASSEPFECPGRSGALTSQRDIYFRHHAIGSLIHLHLTSLPHVVTAFADPHLPSLALR